TYSYLPFFYAHHTATSGISTLSLHDALPICAFRIQLLTLLIEVRHLHVGALPDLAAVGRQLPHQHPQQRGLARAVRSDEPDAIRSEEHTSELQSLAYLVCRLLLEKKKKMNIAKSNSWMSVCSKLTMSSK